MIGALVAGILGVLTYSISSEATDVGCCFLAKDGQKCGTASPDNCVADSPFAEGALCSQHGGFSPVRRARAVRIKFNCPISLATAGGARG